MSKLIYSLKDHDFLDLYRKEANPRVRMRFLAMQHKKEGGNFVEIADILKVTRQAVMDWHSWFVEYGIDGLYDEQRSGRKPKLARENEESFLRELEKLQDEKGGGRITGRSIHPKANKEAQEEFKKKLSRFNKRMSSSKGATK